MEIHTKIIPHTEQRYNTCGDYFEKDGVTEFRISDMGNDDYHFLVLIHEMLEQYLTKKRGIKEEDITKFDVEFEKIRELYPEIIGNQEPGNMESAPYNQEHIFATVVEKALAGQLNVDWKKYELEINSL